MNPGGSSWLQSCRVSAAAFSVTDWWLSLIIDYWLKLWRGLDGWWCHSVLLKHWSLLAERLPTYCWPQSHKVYFITCVDVFCDGYFVVKMFLNAKVKAVSWIKEQTCDSLRAVDGPTPQNKCPVRQTDIQQVQSTHNQTSPPTKSVHILTTHRWSVRVFQLSVKFKKMSVVLPPKSSADPFGPEHRTPSLYSDEITPNWDRNPSTTQLLINKRLS